MRSRRAARGVGMGSPPSPEPARAVNPGRRRGVPPASWSPWHRRRSVLEESGMRPSDDDRALLAARRARVLGAMGEGVMLLPAATELIRSGDTHFPFRQDSDFGYLTGFPEPDAVAVLAVGAEKPYALFVRPRDPEQAVWGGPRAGVEGAVAG